MLYQVECDLSLRLELRPLPFAHEGAKVKGYPLG